jgi:hypothetical protein
MVLLIKKVSTFNSLKTLYTIAKSIKHGAIHYFNCNNSMFYLLRFKDANMVVNI